MQVRLAGPLSEPALRDAVQAALAAEHAAIWSYGLASAYLPPDANDAVTAAGTAHRTRRDATVAALAGSGVGPVPAAAAYRPPRPVTDAASAASLLVVAEEDVAAAWRAACERTEADTGRPLRTLGIDGVVTSAQAAVTWRRLAGTTPVVATFPGG